MSGVFTNTVQSIENERKTVHLFKDTTVFTKTDKTKQRYLKTATEIVRKVGKLINQTEGEADPRQVVAWIKMTQHIYAKNSFRQYKASLMYYFTQVVKTHAAFEAADMLIDMTDELSTDESKFGAANKSKNLNERKYIKIINWLMENNSKYAAPTICWLQAGLICGFRPSEWRSAEFVQYNGKLALKVKNGKNTNGRANGDNRVLVLSHCSDDEINIIKQQIHNIQYHGYDDDSYNLFYNSCKTLLNTANKACLAKHDKRITLYSARHQFSANAKAANIGRAHLAAMMGHATDDTASQHYGRKQFGNKSSVRVEPIQEQVATVKVIENHFIEQRQDYFKDLNSRKVKNENKENKENVTKNQIQQDDIIIETAEKKPSRGLKTTT